jgi:hypothetical protein
LPDHLRLPVVLVFLLAGPGLAVVPLLRLTDPFAELVIAAGISLTADLLVAEAFVLSSRFSGTGALLALVALCPIGVGLQILSGADDRPASPGRLRGAP